MSNNYTPSDKIARQYKHVNTPVIGSHYHLSWAYAGARFKLISIDGENGVVNTGKTNRKNLNIKLADLRHLRNRKTLPQPNKGG